MWKYVFGMPKFQYSFLDEMFIWNNQIKSSNQLVSNGNIFSSNLNQFFQIFTKLKTIKTDYIISNWLVCMTCQIPLYNVVKKILKKKIFMASIRNIKDKLRKEVLPCWLGYKIRKIGKKK